ncbi:hypothetical protein E3U26_00470 [Paracoccus ferrooxidans]|nr:hypothetical protein E3U26_00470 [Paracoccus ferrooxidans]
MITTGLQSQADVPGRIHGLQLLRGSVRLIASPFHGLNFGLGCIAAMPVGLADCYGVEAVYRLRSFLPLTRSLPAIKGRRHGRNTVRGKESTAAQQVMRPRPPRGRLDRRRRTARRAASGTISIRRTAHLPPRMRRWSQRLRVACGLAAREPRTPMSWARSGT